jgi:hypothetical protein
MYNQHMFMYRYCPSNTIPSTSITSGHQSNRLIRLEELHERTVQYDAVDINPCFDTLLICRNGNFASLWLIWPEVSLDANACSNDHTQLRTQRTHTEHPLRSHQSIYVFGLVQGFHPWRFPPPPPPPHPYLDTLMMP